MFDDESVARSLQPLPTVTAASVASPGTRRGEISKPKQRPSKEPPAWHVDEETARGTDKVEELLQYLNEVYDDCQYEAETIQVAEEIKPLVEETARLMDKQQEAVVAASRTTERSSEALALMTVSPPTDPAHWSRLLLSHFNMVDYDQRAMFAMLESGTPLQRSINTLDTKRAREAFKVGVIYVRKGQDTQEQILRNETRSQYYDAFVRSLAWEVNMATHRGYNGGLDVTKFLTGTTAPYYATARIELMLHEITAMPTDHKDEQQIHKKRHVGNDGKGERERSRCALFSSFFAFSSCQHCIFGKQSGLRSCNHLDAVQLCAHYRVPSFGQHGAVSSANLPQGGAGVPALWPAAAQHGGER